MKKKPGRTGLGPIEKAGKLARDPDVRRATIIIAIALCAAAALVGARNLVRRSGEFAPRRFSARLVTRHPGGDPRSVLRDLAGVPVRGASVLHRGFLGAIAERYAGYPWVSEVKEVRRVLPDGIVVTVEARAPIVAVAAPGLKPRPLYLVDADGIRLPDTYYDHIDPARTIDVPYATGLSGRPPAVGEPYAGGDLGEALAVARELDAAGVYRRVRVQSIDVSNVGGRKDPRASEVVVRTAAGVAIEWGRSPQRQGLGEPEPSAKLASLDRVLRQNPALKGVNCVRLPFPDPVVCDGAPQALAEAPRRRR